MNSIFGAMGVAIALLLCPIGAMPSHAQLEPPTDETNIPNTSEISEITSITVTALEDGLQLVLVTTDSTTPEVFQFQENNTLVVDIVGARLALPTGNGYQQENPVPSVASLTVEQVTEQEVRITVVGSAETAPNAYLERAAESLIVDIVTTDRAEAPPSPELDFGDNLRIIVVAEPLPRYRVPTARAGTRTDTDILNVPQGIQVIPQAVIEDQGATSLGEALRNVSGVSPGRSAAGGRATTPIIRGFETDNILRNGLRDDTLRLSSGITNVEQVEILKGPASVLFGAGNLGGTINLITEVPLSEPFYELELTAGSDAFYQASIDLTSPLREVGGPEYRLNLAYEDRGSFRDFENGNFLFVAPSLQLIETERTNFIIDFEYLNSVTRETAPGLPAISAIGVEDNTLVDTILSSGGEIPEADLEAAGTLDIAANLGEPEISRTETSILRVAYRFEHDFSENWTFRNEFLGSFQDTPEDTSVVGVGFVQEQGQPNLGLLNRIYIDNPNYRENLTLNTNLVGDFEIAGIDQTLLLGLEWSREEARDKIVQRLFLPFLSSLEPFQIFDPNYNPQRFFDETDLDVNEILGSDTFTRTRTIGLYGQTQLNFSDRLIVLLGGRLDFANQTFQDEASRVDTSTITTSDTVFSPRVGLVFKPADNVSLYASYTESFNPVIGISQDGEVFSPERGNQIEVGVKADLLGDRLSATLAYYRLRRTNVLTQDPTNPGFQVQVGEQASDGVELDIVGEFLPGWSIIASYAYTDARVSEDNEFPVGRRLLNVPENAASLWTSYEIQGGDLAGLGFGVGVFFQGDRNGDIRTPFTLPSYTRTDAAIFYRRGRLNAQVNFQNLLNVRYFEGARDQFRVNPGAPFTVLGSLSWEF
ncbi:MAG: TonB-dependent siderophore receptor [Synechococcales bacterium]|nr:TonB-dependent siderophore receptor [Synechococcales bacterium]